LLKQWLHFPFKKEIETMNRLAKMHGQKVYKQRLDLPLEKEIETMDRLPTIQGQRIVETTLTFSI